MTIYEKLSNIQKELIAPKGQRNDFGKYNYRSCEDIIHALKPLCDANKCLVFMTNDLMQVGDRTYVKATVTLADLESDATIVSTAHAREEEVKKGMDGSQITGASSSYARKYALAGLFMIDNEKDSDATNKGDSEQPKKGKRVDTVEEANNIFPTPGCITPEQKVQVLRIITDSGVPREKLLAGKEIDDLTVEEFEKLKAWFDSKKKE